MKCLHAFKYIIIILIVPPFLNYAALVQESSQLLPEGLRLDSFSYHAIYLLRFILNVYIYASFE